MAALMPDSAAAQAPSGDKPGTDSPDALDHAKVLSEFNARSKNAKAHWADWRTEARQLYDLIAGRQWDAEDEAKLRDELRPMVTFNVSEKYIDALVGLQINNRQETRFYPRKEGDAQTNDILTGAVAWGRDLCDQLDEETDAFKDGVLTGMGWMEGYLDTDIEEGGVPAGQRVDNLEMLPDPASRKRNFADARFLIRTRFMDRDEYQQLVGDDDGGTDDGDDPGSDAEDDDDGFRVVEEPQDYDNEPGSSGQMRTKAGKIPVSDYQFWRREKRYVVSHPQLGNKELTKGEHEAYQPFLKAAKANGQKFDVRERMKKVYYRAYIARGAIKKLGLSPYQGGFTYHAITGKRDRNKNTWYGIGRTLLDPQRWLNKFFSTILYVLMTNAKGGIMAEEGAFKDARKAESEWANPNSITWMKEGALQKEKVMPKPPANYPQGLDRLMDFTLNSLPQTTGLPVELMGLADRQQAGVVEAQRKQSAMAIIAWAFDAMRRYYRSIGRQQARYVIDYVPENTLIKINGPTQAQYVPLVKQQVAMEFDVVTDEAPTSVNMQERVWAVIESMVPQMLQAGMAIPPSVLDYSPLPQDLIQDWKKALQPDPSKGQMDQQMMMTTLRKLVSEAMKNESQAQLNTAKAGQAAAETEHTQVSTLHTAAEAGAAQAQAGM